MIASTERAPRRTLVITNDFPPRRGGIQTFVWELAVRQPPGSVVVYASDFPGSAEFDAAAPFPIIRDDGGRFGWLATRVLGGGMLLPSTRVGRRARELLSVHECSAVWFGAAAPLGLLAPGLRQAGARRLVATTHGHEVGWAILPGARQMLRRIGRGVDVITVLGSYTRRRLSRAVGEGRPGHAVLERMTPGVDPARFAGARDDGRRIRERLGVPADAPVIACVSRLVPRKGQDALIRSMSAVRAAVPGTMLVIVGRGRDQRRLRRILDRESSADPGLRGSVIFAGAAPEGELPAYFGIGDVFAMPCRTRRAGLDVEGLGIVFLEASAAGLPVVVGDSGGAPDAVQDGVTGRLVDGRDVPALSAVLIELLRDEHAADAMGAAGSEWVAREWTWDAAASRLRSLLDS